MNTLPSTNMPNELEIKITEPEEPVDLSSYTDINDVISYEKNDIEMELWPTHHSFCEQEILNKLSRTIAVSLSAAGDDNGEVIAGISLLKTEEPGHVITAHVLPGQQLKFFVHAITSAKIENVQLRGKVRVDAGPCSITKIINIKVERMINKSENDSVT